MLFSEAIQVIYERIYSQTVHLKVRGHVCFAELEYAVKTTKQPLSLHLMFSTTICKVSIVGDKSRQFLRFISVTRKAGQSFYINIRLDCVPH